jgi:hypothetical protein
MAEEQNNNNAQEQQLFIADVSCCAYFKIIPTQYLNVTGLFIGKVKIATYYMDMLSSKYDLCKYVVNSPLPTINDHIGRFETEEECKQACIRVAKVFCNQLQNCTTTKDINN